MTDGPRRLPCVMCGEPATTHARVAWPNQGADWLLPVCDQHRAGDTHDQFIEQMHMRLDHALEDLGIVLAWNAADRVDRLPEPAPCCLCNLLTRERVTFATGMHAADCELTASGPLCIECAGPAAKVEVRRRAAELLTMLADGGIAIQVPEVQT